MEKEIVRAVFHALVFIHATSSKDSMIAFSQETITVHEQYGSSVVSYFLDMTIKLYSSQKEHLQGMLYKFNCSDNKTMAKVQEQDLVGMQLMCKVACISPAHFFFFLISMFPTLVWLIWLSWSGSGNKFQCLKC